MVWLDFVRSRSLGRRQGRKALVLRAEFLEPRRVCATFTVTSGFDSGVGFGELRTMIFQSNNTPGHDTIVFAPQVSNINLILGELDIVDDLTIDGSTSLDGAVTIQAALGNARIFNVDDADSVIDTSVTMNQLILTHGNVVGLPSNAGGAIRNREVLRLQNSIVTGNHADYGGGIANEGALYLDRVTIEGNQATQHGGGVFSTAGSLDFERVTIANNDAGLNGGGFYLRSSGAQWKQVTIADNTAGGRGGGIYLEQGASPNILIRHSTISDNTAELEGGGIHAALAPLQLDQTIVASNRTAVLPGTPDIFSGPNLTARFSLIGDRRGSALAEALPDANGNLVGGPVGGVLDPRLGTLTNNGGTTATMMLTSGSPAINAGDPNFSSPPSFDQRGAPYARVATGRIDIGAVEYQPQGPDFDDNGILDCQDVDALVGMIATGGHHPRFDLTGDGQVTTADLDRWLALAGDANLGGGASYLYGDANLDGVVDASDFGAWNANKFTTQAAWCRGDFTADGSIDGSDFGIWNQNKFTSALRPHSPVASPIDAIEANVLVTSAGPAWSAAAAAASGRALGDSMDGRAARLRDRVFAEGARPRPIDAFRVECLPARVG